MSDWQSCGGWWLVVGNWWLAYSGWMGRRYQPPPSLFIAIAIAPDRPRCALFSLPSFLPSVASIASIGSAWKGEAALCSSWPACFGLGRFQILRVEQSVSSGVCMQFHTRSHVCDGILL